MVPHDSKSDLTLLNFKKKSKIHSALLFFRRKLRLITDLLTEENLSKNVKYGFVKSLQAEKIQTLLRSVSQEYCRQILGLGDICDDTLKGCGLDDDCGYRACFVDLKGPKGYVCVGKLVCRSERRYCI